MDIDCCVVFGICTRRKIDTFTRAEGIPFSNHTKKANQRDKVQQCI